MSRTNRKTVAELAKEAEIELDETLLILWDNGIENITSPFDVITGASLEKARRALKIPTKHELTSLSFWQNRYGLDNNQFVKFLKERGIIIVKGTRKLPKGSVKKLIKELPSRNENEIETFFQITPSIKPVQKAL